jgi:hypothetical protein
MQPVTDELEPEQLEAAKERVSAIMGASAQGAKPVNGATRKQRSDAGKPRESLYIQLTPAVRIDLSVPEGRQYLKDCFPSPEENRKTAWPIIEALLAHIDKLRARE